MDKFLHRLICCPDCRGKLLSLDSSLKCETCKTTFSIEGGIPLLFSKELAHEPEYKTILREYQNVERETETNYLSWESYLNMNPYGKVKYHLLSGPSGLKLRRTARGEEKGIASLCQFIGSTEGLTVLDIGCREGRILSLLGGGSKIGFDISPYHLRYVKERGDSGVAGFAERLPFKDNSFDVVISSHVLEHVLRLEAMTAEIDRVMRPTGRAVIEVPFGETEESLSTIDKDTEEIVMKNPSGRHKKRRTALHLRNFNDEKDLEVLFPSLQATRKQFHSYKLKRNLTWWVKILLRPSNRLPADSFKKHFPGVFSPRNIGMEFISKK